MFRFNRLKVYPEELNETTAAISLRQLTILQCTDAAGDTLWSLLRVNTDTVELVYCEVENIHLCVSLSSLGLSWKSPNCTAKPCPVLLTGRRWLMTAPEAEGSAASQQNLCPAACPGHRSPSGTCVQHSQSLHSSAAQPETCYSTYFQRV